jgi:7-cyano-7-deazaguanine synthase
MARELAIVLNSGSLNSAVVTALAAQKYRPVMVHVDAAASPTRARLAYDQQVARFKPYREHTVPFPLLGTLDTRQPHATAIDPRVTPEVTPRLVSLLPVVGLAMHLAVHYSAATVYLGLRVGLSGDELARATEWGQIWNEMIQMACGQVELELATPLLELEHWQVVELGYQVGAPLELSWSCHDLAAAEPCGRCTGCQLRDAAFTQAAKKDPAINAKR